MNRNGYILGSLVLSLTALVGCSSAPATKEPAKLTIKVDKIQGKAQINIGETTSTDAALNAGGQSTYIWEGVRRYRLFFKDPFKAEPGKEYAVEGVWAQKAIDEIGDPDQGKNGYPLQSSCERVVGKTWPGLPFDVTDGHVSVLVTRIKRYPARPVFLVTKITAVESEAKKEEKELPEISVPAEKQKAALLESPKSLKAPLWEPKASTVTCKVIIGKDGKIDELESGTQLCEGAPWNEFKYQPPTQGGKPVKIKTEVELKYEPLG